MLYPCRGKSSFGRARGRKGRRTREKEGGGGMGRGTDRGTHRAEKRICPLAMRAGLSSQLPEGRPRGEEVRRGKSNRWRGRHPSAF